MGGVIEGRVGILPAGALGVAFFYHLTHGAEAIDDRVVFLSRRGSESAGLMQQLGVVQICEPSGSLREVAGTTWLGDLRDAADSESLPEIILVCTQPDQLLGIIAEFVALIERAFIREENVHAAIPSLVLCSNGIYFQRIRQYFLEKLEDSILLGRLPDLWPDDMPAVVGKLVRGVTIQTGQRDGNGAQAIYRPGPRGRTRVAGGSAKIRSRVVEVLEGLGGWFQDLGKVSPTRAEFDKALVNLTVNLLGQLTSIDSAGTFRARTIRELLNEENKSAALELARRVVEVGKAVRAYDPGDTFEELWEQMLASCREYLDHVPSSLQWISLQLEKGAVRPRLGPTEKWLIEPLVRYAHAAGLEDAAVFFQRLTQTVEEKLALLAATAKRKEAGPCGPAS